MTGSQTHVCASCGTENPNRQLYCLQCWYPLSIVAAGSISSVSAAPTDAHSTTVAAAGRAERCKSCGHENPDGQLYCLKCWAPLTVSTPVARNGEPVQAPSLLPDAAAPDVAPSPRSAPHQTYGSDERAIAFVVVTMAFAAAVFVRFYGLGDIPSSLQPAEDAVRRAALALPGDAWPAFWSDSTLGQPAGLVYLASGWASVLGESVMALRLLPALIGLATLSVFFVFCRSLLGPRAATLGTLLTAFSMWHLGHSRLLVPAGLVPLLVLLVGYLLHSALEERRDSRRRSLWLLGAGVSFGAGFYYHNVLLIFGAAVLVLWARELLATERPSRSTLRSNLAFFVPALVVALPFIVALGVGWGEFTEQWSETSVFGAVEYGDLSGIPEETRYLVRRVSSGLGALLSRPTATDQTAEALPRFVDPVTALLVLAGLLVALWRWRERRYFLLLTIFGAGVATAAFTTGDGLYGRLGVALPAVFAFTGLALDGALTSMKGRLSDPAGLAAVGAAIAIVAVYNAVSYYREPARYGVLDVASSQEIRPAVLYWVSGTYPTKWSAATSDSAGSNAPHRLR